MKNFNKLTAILSLLIFTFSLINQAEAYGQQWLSTDDLNPPTNLTAEVVDDNDVSLFWVQPYNADSTYIHWDNGENYTSYGNFIYEIEMDYAAKWDPEHITAYDGWIITEMRFYVVTPMPTINLKIWTGPDAEEIYSQELTDWNVNEWTEVTLDTPVTIDASTQLWAGLNIDMPVTGASMGCDEGPAIPGNGDNYRINDVWHVSGLNWNIQIKVESQASRSTNGLLGYNIYRDEEQINTETLSATSYFDENLLNNTYDYYVTAVYDDGESIPSDTVEVIVDQPGILVTDSLALVDLYNSCGGYNWMSDDLWLEGPVNEWEGITTSDNRVTKIWLQSRGLVGDVPESIGDLTALEELHLESNAITSIPDNIGDLVALKDLWLGWNPISSVPLSIGDLSNLEYLHLGLMEEPLDILPFTFGNLSSLKWLGLGGSGLNELPENFGDLTSLESCFLWGNNLTELPESFGGLESLVYLSMYANQLTSLPDNFGNLSNLEQLFMEDNQLTSLPDSFGNLSSLFMLRFEDNQISSLPESFGDLDNLSWLYAYRNQLTDLPESFGSLESLDSLYLFNNLLTSLPESFGNLSDLNLLSLEKNAITELPASFGTLATVEQIYLNDNHLNELPEDFDGMPQLIMLIMVNNDLSNLPESICDLPALKYLYAGGNQITEIPTDVGNLESLTHLAMDFNNITEIPAELGNISGLEYINLNHNQISTIPAGIGDLEYLTTFAIGNNNISEIPETIFGNYFDYLWLQENALQFGSLEPFMGQVSTEYLYYSQAMIGTDTMIDVPYDQVISYTIEVSGDDNIYNWYKDGTWMPDQTTNTLHIENASNADIGVYVLKVTNTTVPDLELVSYNFTVSDITSVDNTLATEFKMYPNPANGNSINVNVIDHSTVSEVMIMNVSGQLVKTVMNINQNTNINISELTKGMYLVKVVYNNGQHQTEKLIVR